MWASIPSKSAPEWACSENDCEPGSPTWASRLAPSATLSGKHTQPPSWQRAWKKAAWMRHLSGSTSSPSTLAPGLEQWIASLRDSRAKTCPLLAAAPGWMANGPASSSTSLTLPTLAVRGSSFWRTSQASLVQQLPLWTKKAPPSMSGITTRKAFRKWVLKMAAYSKEQPPASWENWPIAGGMRNGSLFQRPTWAPAMGGNGGFVGRGENWATPQASAVTFSTELQCSGDGRETPNKLGWAVGTWATPTSSDNSNRTTKIAPSHGISHGLVLAGQAASWATPKANDAEKRGNVTLRPGLPELVGQAQAWPTPKGTDGTKGGPNQAGSKGDLMLPSAAAQWPTPAARDSKGANSAEHALITGGGRKHMDQLSNFVAHSLHLAQTTPDGPTSCESGPASPQPSTKRLNPAFGEWLMGWPVGWTIAEPNASNALETELWRSALQQQLCSWFAE